MHKHITFPLIIAVLVSLPLLSQAQDTLAAWTFPSGQPADTLADVHNAANAGKALHTAGGVSGLLTFTNGVSTYAATCTGWDNGMLTKCWSTAISTLNYQNLSLSSRQRSGGNNPGPRDFSLQYNISGNWIDIPGSNVTVVNDWSGELLNIPIPSDCENQAAVQLRWVMTSNTNSLGDPVNPVGISKIDDIIIKGDIITSIPTIQNSVTVSVYPLPCHETLNFKGSSMFIKLRLIDCGGKTLVTLSNISSVGHLNMSAFPDGLYFLQFIDANGGLHSEKFIKSSE